MQAKYDLNKALENIQIQHIPTMDVQILDTALRDVNKENPKYISIVEDLKRGNPIHNPIIVKLTRDLDSGDEFFELVEGRHRLNAALSVKMDLIPALVLPEDTPRVVTMGLQIRSNTLRVEQNPAQVAKQLVRMMNEDPTITVQDLAEVAGTTVAWIKDKLKFTPDHMDERVINLVEEGKMPAESARILAAAGTAIQNDDVIKAAATLPPKELKSLVDTTKQQLLAGQKPEPPKPKEPKVFVAKYKPRDRAIVETEISTGGFASAVYSDDALKQAFLHGVSWAVSLDEDTVSKAREEFDLKQSQAEQLKKEEQRKKKEKQLEELQKELNTTVQE